MFISNRIVCETKQKPIRYDVNTQSPDTSYLPLERKSVQLMNVSLLPFIYFALLTQIFKNSLQYIGIRILKNTTIRPTD